MEQLWDNVELFNELMKTFIKLDFNAVKDYPAQVYTFYHVRDENGSLSEDGIPKILTLEHLMDLEKFRYECDDAYLIKKIILYPKDTKFNTGDEIVSDKPGLVLDINGRIGNEICRKYDLYSYSWFDSEDSC